MDPKIWSEIMDNMVNPPINLAEPIQYSLDDPIRYIPMPIATLVGNNRTVSLGYKEEKEHTMRMSDIPTLEAAQKDYFIRRLGDEFEKADRKLSQKFGLVEDDPPESLEEFLSRLNKKQYTLDHEWEEAMCCTFSAYSFIDRIEWRDPSKKRDRKGYDKAFTTLRDLRDSTKDKIMAAMSPAAYIDALEDFTSSTVN